MVSQETQINNPSSTSNLYHFLISDHFTNQSPFGIPDCNPKPYGDTSFDNAHFSTIQSLEEAMSRSINHVHDQSDMGHATRHFKDLLGEPNEHNLGPYRLSLSIGSKVLQPHNSMQFIHQPYDNLVSSSGDYYLMENSSLPAFSVSSSGYLNPIQSILEEVIDLGSKNVELSEVKRLFLSGRGVCNELRAELLGNRPLSSDKYELQIKLSKLMSLPEEVEGIYNEYTHRMEDLISSFEVVAGEGAAKCYTALALQAVCRHFCTLRDAIVTQIKMFRKKSSRELPKLGNGPSHLSLFRHEGWNSNNQLTLQCIGIMQGSHRQSWRPIHGLPETLVAILRAWLFEHFLHPYPNDSEKLTLASQTSLSKNQVSNWFINARVRLWKPMIEECTKMNSEILLWILQGMVSRN